VVCVGDLASLGFALWVSGLSFDCGVLWVSNEKNWYGFVVGFCLSVKKE
jgi:hypothetical protein